MADAAPTQPNSDPVGGGDPKPGEGGTPPATDPKGGATPPTGGDIDLSALPADQLNKVLENKEFWNIPRIKELRDQAAEAKKLKDAAAKSEDKLLEDQKKFEDLATKRGTKVTELEQRIQNMTIDQALTNKLVPEGVVDIEAALKLVDRSNVKVDENTGQVTGVEEVITALKTDKAYLFGKPGQTTVGSPTNPKGQPSGPAKFKRSQLRDTAFYQEHREEILAAQKAGLIEDDIS